MIFLSDATMANIRDYFASIEDSRTDNLFLASSPYPTIGLIAAYLIIVNYALPAYMRKRPPYSLSTVLVYYNIFQVIFSAYLFYMCIIASGYGRRYNILKCRELDQSTTDPDAISALKGIHLFFISKFIEFFDTFFFLLRKKNNQVSFLHLYHHASMPFASWLGLKFAPGGSAALAAGINSSIHFFMYSYYLLSGLGPEWQKYVWWKKYMTKAQIIQFVYMLCATIVVYMTRNECPIFLQRFPLILFFFAYVSSILLLFYRFYYNTYNKKKL